jgi:hypothetical protein
MRNVSDICFTENQCTHFMFNTSPPPENRAVYDVLWKTTVQTDRQTDQDDNIIRRMWSECWTNKVTDTHCEYVTLNPFLRKHWLRERASVLRYTYIASLVPLHSPVLCLAFNTHLSEGRGGTACEISKQRSFRFRVINAHDSGAFLFSSSSSPTALCL